MSVDKILKIKRLTKVKKQVAKQLGLKRRGRNSSKTPSSVLGIEQPAISPVSSSICKFSKNYPKQFIGKGFKKGVSGNPHGRPLRGETYSDVVRDILSGNEVHIIIEYPGKSCRGKQSVKSVHIKSDKNMYYGVAAAQLIKALNGDTFAARELIDRAQGKSPQQISIKPNEKDIPIAVYKLTAEFEKEPSSE